MEQAIPNNHAGRREDTLGPVRGQAIGCTDTYNFVEAFEATRKKAEERVKRRALAMNADYIANLRFDFIDMENGSFLVVAFGTAMKSPERLAAPQLGQAANDDVAAPRQIRAVQRPMLRLVQNN